MATGGKRNALLWVVWLAATLVAGSAIASVTFFGGSRELLLIGQTTGAHHQIEMQCDACHTSGFFADARTIARNMNKACLNCHKDELKVSNDSHPVKKFRDPRNADRRAVLDALYCTTCHAEHVEEVTRPVAVTKPLDYCAACHQDVGKDRPSHKGLSFETCASGGCHNFHDNTALYEDFLARHLDMPDFAAKPVLAFFAADRAAPATLGATKPPAPLAPAERLTDEAVAAWQGSGHARAGVNCAGCHAPKQAKSGDLDAIAASWIESPNLAVCAGCHKREASTFREGKHGMRLHPELPKPRHPGDKRGPLAFLGEYAALFDDAPMTPMPVAEARIPMKPNAAQRTIGTCNACHAPHDVDIRHAAVEACAGCHDDPHTRAYFASPHYSLWQAEIAGDGAPGSGVSCADCHMPKLEVRGGGVYTTHNQNAYLRPNEKMIRPVCLSCHGIAFAIDALADPELVDRNFNGQPSRHVESVDWVAKRARKTE